MDAVVYREARVSPLAHAVGEVGIKHAFVAEEIQHLVAQCLAECLLRQRWQ